MTTNTINLKSVVVAVLLVVSVLTGRTGGQPIVWQCADGGNNHMYEAVYAPDGVSWNQAQQIALERGGYLATITSSAESNFVYTIASANPALWRLNARGNGYGPWIGGFQPPGSVEPAGGWSWVTGEAWGFTLWQAGEPSNFGGNEDGVCYYALGRLMQNRWNDLGRDNPYPRSFVVEWGSPLLQQPVAAVVCPGDTATFSVVVSTEAVPVSFSWRRNGVALSLATTPSAGTATLVIHNVDVHDIGVYDCSVAFACSVVASTMVPLDYLPDINGDGGVNTPDLVFLLGRFGQTAVPGSLAAMVDFNLDGAVNTADLTYFLGRFGRACP